jgi:hypothetical protein
MRGQSKIILQLNVGRRALGVADILSAFEAEDSGSNPGGPAVCNIPFCKKNPHPSVKFWTSGILKICSKNSNSVFKEELTIQCEETIGFDEDSEFEVYEVLSSL